VLRRSKIKSNNSFFFKHRKDYFSFSNSRLREPRVNRVVEQSQTMLRPKTVTPVIFSISRSPRNNSLSSQETPKYFHCNLLGNTTTCESQIISNNQMSERETPLNEGQFVPNLSLSQPTTDNAGDIFSSQKTYLESERFKALILHMLYQKRPQLAKESIDPFPSPNAKDAETEKVSFALLNIQEPNSRQTSDSKNNALHRHAELSLLYDFYRETFKFSEKELAEFEPIPEYAWIHSSCAFWIPELYCSEDFDNLDISALGLIDKTRFSTSCIVCNSTRGAVINCCGPNCDEWFHAECARRAKLHFEIQQNSECKFLAFCPKHTTLPCKKKLDAENQKSIDDILKFHKYFKRFLKNNKLLSEDTLRRAQTIESLMDDSLRENTSPFERLLDRKLRANSRKQLKFEKPQIEHMVKYLPYEHKHFLRYLRDEIEFEPKLSFHVQLSVDKEGGYRFKSATQPKNIFEEQICRDNRLWRKLADSLQITAKAAHKRYENLLEQLRSLASSCPPQNLIVANGGLSESQSSPMRGPFKKHNGNYIGQNLTRRWSDPHRFSCLSFQQISVDCQASQDLMCCQDCGEFFHTQCAETWIPGECSEGHRIYCINCRTKFKNCISGGNGEKNQLKSTRRPLRSAKKFGKNDRELDMKNCVTSLLSEKDCYEMDCFLRLSQPQLFRNHEIKGIHVRSESAEDSKVASCLVSEDFLSTIPVMNSRHHQEGPLELKDANTFRDGTVDRSDLQENTYPGQQSHMLVEEEHPEVVS